MNDNRKQLRMLRRLARAAGYHSINQWAADNMGNFVHVSMSWRIMQEHIL